MLKADAAMSQSGHLQLELRRQAAGAWVGTSPVLLMLSRGARSALAPEERLLNTCSTPLPGTTPSVEP